MTIFAVMCAGIFPGIHVGRVWVVYWLFPTSEPDGDVAAVPQSRCSGTCSRSAPTSPFRCLFWYTGLIPDLATLRDRAKGRLQQIATALFALGWRGSNRHWHRYERAYSPARGAFDTRWCSRCTRWCPSTSRSVSSRLAHHDLPAVLRARVRSSPASPWWSPSRSRPARCSACVILITLRHLDFMNKVILADRHAWSVTPTPWSSSSRGTRGTSYEEFRLRQPGLRSRTAWAYLAHGQLQRDLAAALLVQEALRPQHPPHVRCLSLVVNVGMWFERFVIIGHFAQPNDFLPSSSWDFFSPTCVDIGATRIGAFRPVLHPVPAVLPLPATGRDRRSQVADPARP